MLIAGLDIESGSQDRMRAVVHDVGIVVVDTNYFGGKGSLLSQNTKRYGIRLNVMEQILAGRVIDAKGVKFHSDNLGGVAEFQRHLEKAPSQYAPYDVRTGLLKIKGILDECEEVWINGLSFDPILLHTLAETFNINDPLWFYRKEVDVRSINTQLKAVIYRNQPKRKTPHKVAHDAIKDAEWNVDVARAFKVWHDGYMKDTAAIDSLDDDEEDEG